MAEPVSPAIFVLHPAAPAPTSWLGVPIHDYTAGVGLSPTPSRRLDLIDVELDDWWRQAFAVIDSLVDLEAAAGAQDRLADLKAAKARIAAATLDRLIPVFADQADPADPATYADPARARAALLAELETGLADAYAVRAVIELDPAVELRAPDSLSLTRFGPAAGADGPATVVVRGPDPVRDEAGAVVASVELGSPAHGITLPLPLARLPPPPTLLGHSASPAPAPGPDLADLTRWDYAFDYARPAHLPHDRLEVEVRFNVAELRATGPRSTPDALAQLVAVYPDVAADLAGAAEPAAAALDAARTMVGWIADAVNPVVRRQQSGYAFELVEGADAAGELIVELIGHPPPGIGDPSVIVDGYATEATHRDGIYRFRFRGEDGGHLSAAAGQTIGRRRVVLPGLAALERRSAVTAVSVERNRMLIPGRESAPPFVLRTPRVAFASPLHPFVDRPDLVDIAGPASIPSSLAEHLTALFEALELDRTPELSVAAQLTYTQPPGHRVPVLRQSPAVPGPDMPLMWAAAVETWLAEHRPPGPGELGIDLTVRDEGTPLLRLSGLRLELEHVE